MCWTDPDAAMFTAVREAATVLLILINPFHTTTSLKIFQVAKIQSNDNAKALELEVQPSRLNVFSMSWRGPK